MKYKDIKEILSIFADISQIVFLLLTILPFVYFIRFSRYKVALVFAIIVVSSIIISYSSYYKVKHLIRILNRYNTNILKELKRTHSPGVPSLTLMDIIRNLYIELP